MAGAEAVPPDHAAATLTWDRPLQHLVLALASGRHLHIYNVHLRAPLAVAVPGQKAGPFAWKTISGWADGFFAAAAKRAEFDVVIFEDACRGIDVNGSMKATHESFRTLGIVTTTTAALR